MKGSSDNIMPSIFQYSKYIYATWNYEESYDEEGNPSGYTYDYIELPYTSTDTEIRNALEEKGLTETQINEMFEGRANA